MQPHIWYGENAEFALTDSAQLAEADEECARYLARIKKLESALRVAINTVECASIDVRTGEELPWYVGAKLALREIVNP